MQSKQKCLYCSAEFIPANKYHTYKYCSKNCYANATKSCRGNESKEKEIMQKNIDMLRDSIEAMRRNEQISILTRIKNKILSIFD